MSRAQFLARHARRLVLANSQWVYTWLVPDSNRDATVTSDVRTRVMSAGVWLLERSQDFIAVCVGVVLVGLAAAELVSGIVDFFTGVSRIGLQQAGLDLLYRVLFVLILVEIVHTVVLSLRTHQLIAQPFIVVGLVAVIRKILVISIGSEEISTDQLALLVAMVVVFVASLIAVNWFERRWTRAGRDEGV